MAERVHRVHRVVRGVGGDGIRPAAMVRVATLVRQSTAGRARGSRSCLSSSAVSIGGSRTETLCRSRSRSASIYWPSALSPVPLL